MSNEITLADVQEFLGAFWFHYDEAHYDEMAAAHAADVHYLTRSDSGASPFENLMSPELNGRDAVMEWLTAHREESPYPLRHHATNIHRTGTDGDIVHTRSYIVVNQIANYVPFMVSSGVVNAAIRRSAGGLLGLEFTDVEVILDTTNSVNLADLHTNTAS